MLQSLFENDLAGIGFPYIDQRVQNEENKTQEVVTDYLGPSLAEMLKEKPDMLNQASILNIGIQLVNRIESLHKLGFYHGNLNPSSIFFKGKDGVFIGNFHFSGKVNNNNFYEFCKPPKKQMDFQTEAQTKASFYPDVVFASDQSLKSDQYFAHDDVTSIILIVVFLLKGNNLPWSEISTKYGYQF